MYIYGLNRLVVFIYIKLIKLYLISFALYFFLYPFYIHFYRIFSLLFTSNTRLDNVVTQFQTEIFTCILKIFFYISTFHFGDRVC